MISQTDETNLSAEQAFKLKYKDYINDEEDSDD